jgi:hypothetical protein
MFKQDTDTATLTNALDQDSDDDGLMDGTSAGEDLNANGQKDSGETGATTADSDGDGIQDGTELGLVTPLRDTDGDGIPDLTEIQLKNNITGIEGSPPNIHNIKLNLTVRWDRLSFLYLPVFTNLTVEFDVATKALAGRLWPPDSPRFLPDWVARQAHPSFPA